MNKKGFSLVEIIIVIGIAGILAAIGVPQYIKSIETSKANSAAAFIQTVGAAHRMYKIDHGGYISDGSQITSACNSSNTCPDAANARCSLVSCKYLAAQDFNNNPYKLYLNGGTSYNATCGGSGASGNWVAYICRNSTDSTYKMWGYAVDTAGQVTALNSGNGTPPAP